jgi:hypothetical protein
VCVLRRGTAADDAPANDIVAVADKDNWDSDNEKEIRVDTRSKTQLLEAITVNVPKNDAATADNQTVFSVHKKGGSRQGDSAAAAATTESGDSEESGGEDENGEKLNGTASKKVR